MARFLNEEDECCGEVEQKHSWEEDAQKLIDRAAKKQAVLRGEIAQLRDENTRLREALHELGQ